MIHRLMIDGCAEPQRVGAGELGDIGRRCVGRIVPRVRIPTVRGTLRAHAVAPVRHAALADVGTVRAGNAKRQAVVRAVVRAVPPLVEERVADGRGDPRLRLPEATAVERQLLQVAHRRVHHADLSPDLMDGTPVPVDLHVVLIAVEGAEVLLEVVAGIPRSVRQRVEIVDPLGDRIDPIGGDDVAGKRLTSASVHVAGERIVDPLQRPVGIERLAEIAAAHFLGGNGVDRFSGRVSILPFERAEVKQLALDDRPAERPAVDVVIGGQLGSLVPFGEETLSAQVLIGVVAKARSPELIRARLGNHGDRRAAGESLIGGETAGGHIDLGDRFRRSDVQRVMRQPRELIRGAVHAGAVGVAIRAVDVGRQRARGRVDLRILKLRRRRARHQVEKALIIAELGQRKVHDLFGAERRRGIGLIGFQQRHLRPHRDRFAQLADLHLRVHAADGAGGDRHLLLHELLESLERHLHVVRAGQHVGEGVRAGVVRHSAQHQVRLAVRDFNRRAGNPGARTVLHGADDAAVEFLGRGTPWTDLEQDQ